VSLSLCDHSFFARIQIKTAFSPRKQYKNPCEDQAAWTNNVQVANSYLWSTPRRQRIEVHNRILLLPAKENGNKTKNKILNFEQAIQKEGVPKCKHQYTLAPKKVKIPEGTNWGWPHGRSECLVGCRNQAGARSLSLPKSSLKAIQSCNQGKAVKIGRVTMVEVGKYLSSWKQYSNCKRMFDLQGNV